MELSAIADSRAPQCRRNQRIRENVQGFVQIRTCMLGGHARAETDSILWYGRIIHRGNPWTASAKFMPNPVHALAISYDDWHYVRCRCSGVETQAFKLRLEIIGVFPKLGTQFRLTGAELQRLENGRDHHGRKRTGVNIRVRVEAQILQRLL